MRDPVEDVKEKIRHDMAEIIRIDPCSPSALVVTEIVRRHGITIRNSCHACVTKHGIRGTFNGHHRLDVVILR